MAGDTDSTTEILDYIWIHQTVHSCPTEFLLARLRLHDKSHSNSKCRTQLQLNRIPWTTLQCCTRIAILFHVHNGIFLDWCADVLRAAKCLICHSGEEKDGMKEQQATPLLRCAARGVFLTSRVHASLRK